MQHSTLNTQPMQMMHLIVTDIIHLMQIMHKRHMINLLQKRSVEQGPQKLESKPSLLIGSSSILAASEADPAAVTTTGSVGVESSRGPKIGMGDSPRSPVRVKSCASTHAAAGAPLSAARISSNRFFKEICHSRISLSAANAYLS